MMNFVIITFIGDDFSYRQNIVNDFSDRKIIDDEKFIVVDFCNGKFIKSVLSIIFLMKNFIADDLFHRKNFI